MLNETYVCVYMYIVYMYIMYMYMCVGMCIHIYIYRERERFDCCLCFLQLCDCVCCMLFSPPPPPPPPTLQILFVCVISWVYVITCVYVGFPTAANVGCCLYYVFRCYCVCWIMCYICVYIYIYASISIVLYHMLIMCCCHNNHEDISCWGPSGQISSGPPLITISIMISIISSCSSSSTLIIMTTWGAAFASGGRSALEGKILTESNTWTRWIFCMGIWHGDPTWGFRYMHVTWGFDR